HLEPLSSPRSVTRACDSSEGIKVGWTMMEPSLVGSKSLQYLACPFQVESWTMGFERRLGLPGS
nr:hypothetical protein [Tanacetum cinerariifolium]